MARSIESPYKALKRRLAERGTPLRELRSETSRMRKGRRWLAFSRSIRQMNPLCQECGERLSAEVHHVIPIRVAPDRVFDVTNVVALCRGCHRRHHGGRTGA